MMISNLYITNQISLLTSSGIKSTITIVVLYITHLLTKIEPYFFGSQFIRILSILMVCDLLVGVGKHIKAKTYSGKQMLNKFSFKLMSVAIATVSAKVMIDIDHALDSNILVIAVKLTVSLYLFGNIEKNICQLTDKKLCFGWLIDKIKDLNLLIKNKK